MQKVEIVYAGVLEGHQDAVYALAAGKDDNIIFSAGGDGMIVRWDLENKGEGTVVARLGSALYSLLYFKDTGIIMAGTRFGGLHILDFKANNLKHLVELKGDVYCLTYLPGPGLIAAGCAGGYLYLISDKDYSIVKTIHPTENHCRSVSLSPDGTLLASGWSDGKIRVYETAMFHEKESYTAHLPSVFSVVFSSNGRQLISGGRDAQLRIWDVSLSFVELHKIPAHLFTINDITLLPGCGMYATASRDKTVKLWDEESNELIKVIDVPKLPAHTHSVNKLLWVAKTKYLLSAGDDKKIRVWGIICG